MHAAAVRYELRIRESRSLKAKRAVVKPIVEGARRRFSVSAAEVDHQDEWHRSAIGVAVVSGSYSHLSEVLDACDRFVWSHPEVEVLSAERRWMDEQA